MQPWFLSFLLTFSISFYLGAQDLVFQKALGSLALPQSPTALLQDGTGFIWIGTTDGLYRYDGITLKEYRHDYSDSQSLSNNLITSLYEDEKKNIWVGTNEGLNCYNPILDNFTAIPLDSNRSYKINHVTVDHQNRVWCATYEGLWQYDPNHKTVRHFLPDTTSEHSLSHKLVWYIMEDSKHRMWAATHLGITVFDNDDSFNFQPYFGDLNVSTGLKTDRVFNCLETADGQILLGTYDGIFEVVEGQQLDFRQIYSGEQNSNFTTNHIINDMIQDLHGQVWFGTYRGGLTKLTFPENGENKIGITRFTSDSNKGSSLSLNRINTLIEDKSGLLWIGTNNGLDLAEKQQEFIKNMSSFIETKNLSHNIIKAIHKDQFGNIWIGTYDGLNYIKAEDLEKGNWNVTSINYDKNNLKGLRNDNIEGINEDSNGYLWVSAQFGLHYFHIPTFMKDGNIEHFRDTDGIPHTFTLNCMELSPGKYLLATLGNFSILHFDHKNPKETNFEILKNDPNNSTSFSVSNAIDFVQDRYGDYWIGTSAGVSKLKFINNEATFNNYTSSKIDPHSLSNNSFRCFHKDRDDNIWIGTRGGLNKVVQTQRTSKATFEVYGQNDGFPNDVIHSIAEDRDEHLWLATNRGLVVLDRNTSPRAKVVRTYNSSDGLSSNNFVRRASYSDEEGRLFFGSANGVDIIDKSKFVQNDFTPPVVFTRLKILDKEANPSQDRKAVLHSSIGHTQKINVPFNQKIVSVEFAALDFTNPAANQYKYTINTLGDSWIELGNKNTIMFTDLSSGQHELSVMGSNSDGIWNPNPATLIIQILPPFYRSWWAYILYSLLVLALLTGIYNYYHFQKSNKKKIEGQLLKARLEERDRLRQKNAADFHDEIGHRLTKISLFLELAERATSSNEPIGEYLTRIKEHTSNLSGGMRDLIWSLDPQKDSLYQTLIRLQEFGDQLFEHSETSFSTGKISLEYESLQLTSDQKKHILMIFKEAMNNCFKYAKADNLTFVITESKEEIDICLSDNGIGYDLLKIKKGYGLKNIKTRAHKLGAHLEIKSILNSGTKICLQLKRNKIEVSKEEN